MHKKHQLGLRVLQGLLNYNMSLIFTLLCTTSQAKALALDGALNFQIKLAREKRTRFDVLDKALKNDLTMNKPEKIND